MLFCPLTGVIPYYTYPPASNAPTPAPPPYHPVPPTAPYIPVASPPATPAPLQSGYLNSPVSGNNPALGPTSGYGQNPYLTASNAGYLPPTAPTLVYPGPQPAANPQVGIPAYAFTGSAGGTGGYGGGLQPVMVQPQSWSANQPQMTPHAVSASTTGGQSNRVSGSKGLPVDVLASRQLVFPSLATNTKDNTLEARNALCGPMRDLVPDAITITLDGIMHLFAGPFSLFVATQHCNVSSLLLLKSHGNVTRSCLSRYYGLGQAVPRGLSRVS